ncbi:MAG: DUF3795 domain-containing protein [Anaerolineales bacterium]
MEPILTRCGNRCDLCLAYKPNVESHPELRPALSDGWFRYFGFRTPPEEIYCEGCMEPHPRLLDTECPVRPCVLEKKLENCSECDQYVCDRLRQRLVVLEELKKKIGAEIPAEDYRRFIHPYENFIRLEELRGRGEPRE